MPCYFPPMRPLRLLLLSALLPGSAASAQVKASEAASVTQTIDGTKMTIEYSRPQARGRKDLFGGEVAWGEVWTAGANQSTTFETSKDITLNGHAVPKGKYSVWLQPRKKGPWMAMFDTNSKRFHVQRPDTTKVPIRFEVEARRVPFVSTLTWGFEDLKISGGRLTMHWGNMGVAMDLAVQPTFELRVAEEVAAPYAGWYDLVPEPADSTKPYRVTKGAVQVEYRNGSLWGKASATMLSRGKDDSYSYEVLLLPNKDGSFSMGLVMNGALAATNPGVIYEFKRSAGKVTGLEERYNDKLEGTYVRRPGS